jgi:hypothetical protein
MIVGDNDADALPTDAARIAPRLDRPDETAQGMVWSL